MAYSYDPIAGQAREDAVGGRVRGVLGMLGRAGAAAAAGFRDFDDAYRQWEAEQKAAEEDSAAVDLAAPPKMVPDVTRKPAWRPTQSEMPDPDSAVADAYRSGSEEDMDSQLRPSGKAYEEPGLHLPGSESHRPAKPKLPTRAEAAAAQPAARKSAADARAASKKASEDSARTQGQRQAAADTGRAAGARRQDASTVGINTDPAKVEADRAAAVADIRKPQPKSARADMQERKERSAVASDTQRYTQERDAYIAEHRRLETLRENALENGRVEEADRLSAEMDALPVPQPTERMLGGQTRQEVMEPVSETLAKLGPAGVALRNHLVQRFLPAGRNATAADRARAERMADEALVSSYDSLEPAERAEVMADDAERVSTPAPLTYGGQDESSPGGFGAGIGDNAKNEDMDPADLQRAGRDIDSGFPMVNKPGQRGGTFVQNPDGTWSRRAPNPHAMKELIPGEDVLPINPREMTREWRDGMKIAGTTLGLDPSKFDNEGQFIAAAQKLLARHRELAAKYDTIPVATGGFRRTPNADTKDAMARRDLAKRVDEFIKMYPNADADALYAAADANDPKELLRLQTEVRRNMKTERAKTAKEYTVRQTQTRVMNNPNVAPGMFVEDMNQAGTDPAAQAAVYRRWGMTAPADRVTALDNQRQAAEFENEQGMAKIDALGNKGSEEQKPALDQAYRDGVDRIVDGSMGANGQDVVDPETSVNTLVMHENQFRQNTGSGKPISKAEGSYMLARNVLTRGAPLGHPVVSFALSQILPGIGSARSDQDDGMLDSKRTTFIKEARNLVVGDKFTDEELGRWFDTNFRS